MYGDGELADVQAQVGQYESTKRLAMPLSLSRTSQQKKFKLILSTVHPRMPRGTEQVSAVADLAAIQSHSLPESTQTLLRFPFPFPFTYPALVHISLSRTLPRVDTCTYGSSLGIKHARPLRMAETYGNICKTGGADSVLQCPT